MHSFSGTRRLLEAFDQDRATGQHNQACTTKPCTHASKCATVIFERDRTGQESKCSSSHLMHLSCSVSLLSAIPQCAGRNLISFVHLSIPRMISPACPSTSGFIGFHSRFSKEIHVCLTIVSLWWYAEATTVLSAILFLCLSSLLLLLRRCATVLSETFSAFLSSYDLVLRSCPIPFSEFTR